MQSTKIDATIGFTTNLLLPILSLNYPIAVFIFLLGSSLTLSAQVEEIHHAKFIAEQAALPVLRGKDPLTLRESWSKGTLKPGGVKLLEQQLFKKNTYQFWFAVADPSSEIYLNIYDAEGKRLRARTEKFGNSTHIISLIISPENTGSYYLRLALSSKAKTQQDWALLYAYK